MKVGTILYLPPPKAYASVGAVIENLQRFPPKHDLIVYGDHDHKWPGQILLKASPENVRGGYNKVANPHRLAINNLVFLTGMRIARKMGYTHVLYLEADCRVGVAGWDDVIFDEFFNLGRPCIAAGTLAVYNPCGAGLSAAKRWENLVSRNVRTNVPVATYGWLPADKKHPSCVFPNGALSVFDMAWIQKLFHLDETLNSASDMPPWDMMLGIEAWKVFGEEAYEVMGYLTSIFSGYGDALTTEEERLEMLRSGRVVGIHQVKSEAKL